MNRVLTALNRRPFAVIGHRCAAGEALENTLSALRRAVEDGADIVEVDVQATRDGVLVLSHDETLGRIAGVNVDIRSSTWSELSDLRLPNGERLTRLDEFLDAIAGVIPAFIEVKHVEDTPLVVKAVRGFEEWIAIISFHDEVLSYVKHHAPGIPVGLIYAKPPGRILDAKRLGASIVLSRYNLATSRAIAFAHRLGLKIVAWTVNSESLALELWRRGVDGIATDYPRVIVELRNRLRGGDEHDSL